MHKTISTSIGDLTLAADDDGAITRVGFGGAAVADADGHTPASGDAAAIDAAAAQLREYLAGERTAFDLSLRPHGNPFEQLVWAELARIPYGETTSYGEIARRIGEPDAARAVGWANGRNPISIVVPCHRVVGADGSLTGYGGGLDRKRRLLDFERGTALF
jgi:methylated-DNA-[protein]-cysteine S-methyltransferase